MSAENAGCEQWAHSPRTETPKISDDALESHLIAAMICYWQKPRIRGVAQLGSASVLGTEGRRFKSCHPDWIRKNPGNITFSGVFPTELSAQGFAANV